MTDTSDLWNLAGAILVSLGGGGVIVAAMSSWLGKVWAERIARTEQARFEKDIARYKSELQDLAEERRDALTRRRDVYGKLIASMRVFQAGGRPASSEDKDAFLLAFDQAALWASEEVSHAIGLFIDGLVHNAQRPGSVTVEDMTKRYADCVNAMRRDTGFPNTTFVYRVVTFS